MTEAATGWEEEAEEKEKERQKETERQEKKTHSDMVRIEDVERETTHREKEQEGARKQRREQEEGESRMEERRGKRKRDGQVEMERREARIRAERLDTSQHSKEETQLTRIRDINERTATRAGDLGYVEGGVHVGTGERTQDTPGVGP